MKILKIVGIMVFFVYYYLFLAYVVLKNLFQYLWQTATQLGQKTHINPYEATHQHVFAPIKQVVSHEGYLMDSYIFQTADGAEVSIWRVRKENTEITKPFPILMMHGLLDCAASWFLHVDKSKSLPYMLAAQGYDVWVGNNRGNRLSRDEEDDCSHYWEYTFDHLVEYDQPAIITGVLRQSGKQKIIYIGHSQGSTQFLLGLGVHSHLQDRIAAFIGLGTVTSLVNVKSHTVMKMLSQFYLLQLYKKIGFKKILVIPKYMSRAVGVLLYNSTTHSSIMMAFIRLLCGSNVSNKVPTSLFGVIITHEPGGASVNNALHWVQCYRSGGKMRKFNYGLDKNMEIYGRPEPPIYCQQHLKELPFNSYLFRGLKDSVMSEQDFVKLTGSFPKDKIFTHQLADYNHLDYVWSESAHHDFYDRIAQIVDNNSN